jgi:heptosyltransferase-2
MTLRTDCRHYRAAEPCAPHKQTGVRCHECSAYDATAQRVVIVKLAEMGDVLRTTSALSALKRDWPGCHVTWVTRRNAEPLLARNPFVDLVLTVESNYLEFLMTEQFDLAIGPDADPLSASIVSLARAAVKRGFAADGRGGIRPLNAAAESWWHMGVDDELKQRNRRTYGEWLYDICELPAPIARPTLSAPRDARRRVEERLRQKAPDATRWIGFNTGASRRWEEKRWKARHYLALARLVSAEMPDTAIVLVGGPDEEAFNRELCRAYPFVDGGTDNSIDDFAALTAACEWVLTPDSLGYHVACAVGTPAVCLVGPTAPWELDRFAANLVLHSSVECIACYRRTCPLPVTCMDVLTPAFVWDRVREWRATGTDAIALGPGLSFPLVADHSSQRPSDTVLPSPIVPVMPRAGAAPDRFRACGATGGRC